ncbi:hypothetical protein J5X84_32880 [Streptosporangiaceae bacterium NEAU-GS5]|nr:hypothetical protein [Streptosporangiaceae bacterium NEAU-GS5]
MGYELRVEREHPLAYADLEGVLSAGFELRGTRESAELLTRHDDAAHQVGLWAGRLSAQPGSDWHVAQLARCCELLGARLVGEDGESYEIRDGILEQVNGSAVYEFGKLEEILAMGPAQWSA